MSAGMDDLLARLRAATRANEGLLVLEALRFADERGWLKDGYLRAWGMWRVGAHLDAALTLVPEGWMATIDHFCLSPDKSTADQWRVWLKQITDDDRVQKTFAVAPTPALALCIAALEARRAGGGA